MDYQKIHNLTVEFFEYIKHWIPECQHEQIFHDLEMAFQKAVVANLK